MNDFIVYYYEKLEHYDMHNFIRDIAKYVEKEHNAKLLTFNEPKNVNIGDLTFELWDCEILFYWPNEDVLKAITFADLPAKTLDFFYRRNNKNDIIIAAQLQKNDLIGYPKNNFKIDTCGYMQSNKNINLDFYHNKRKNLEKFEDALVFRGNVHHAGRTSAELLTKSRYFVGPEGLNIDEYFSNVINHKIGLSIPGVGEKCHRDVEYMAIGLPFIKITKYSLNKQTNITFP